MESTSINIMIGDIGGTNARFSLRKINKTDKAERKTVKEQQLSTKAYPTFEACVKDFLKEYEGSPEYPTIICMGIAGPTKEKEVKITNADWPKFDVEAVHKSLNVKHFKLLNDFEANGYGVLAMDEHSYTKVNNAPIQVGAPKVLIGAGTGLGECVLTKSPESPYYDIFPCEGGHTDFPARNYLEFGYMDYIKNELKLDRVSVERCVAGPAFPSLFAYLRETFPELKSPVYEKNPKPTSEEIVDAGKKKTDPICERAVEIFISLYAAEAGNLALKTLPYGGLYLLSGVTQTLKEKIIKETTFMFNFLRKGRMKGLLEKVPMFIVDANIGMVGAEEAAVRLI